MEANTTQPPILLIYRTPTGRPGRRDVAPERLHQVIRRLTQQGYTGFRAL